MKGNDEPNPKQSPLSQLRSLVCRQDENEAEHNIDTLYVELREAVIALFENPDADILGN